MKKSFLSVLITVVLVISCGKGSNLNDVDEARYQWENIRKYVIEDPELSFRMVDTAQNVGVADVNYANWMRAQIYLNAPQIEDMDKAREYCLSVLDNDDPAPDSLQRVKTYQLLVSIGLNSQNYQEAISYALEGARISHENGWTGEEASFYFNAGQTMEKVQKGSGTEYMDRSLNMFRASKNIQALPSLSSQLGTVARLAVNSGDYSRAIELTQERLQVTERIEKEYTTAPAGYIDQQKAYIYSILAYCQYMNGDKAGARSSVKAFESTEASKLPEHQHDILNYYCLAGDAERIVAIYENLEPYYREKADTISSSYTSLLQSYAYGLDRIGRGHDAYQTMDRYMALTDSLVQRERNSETLMWAQQMKTQEKELQLKEKEMEARLHWIIIVSLSLLLVAGIVFIWRIIAAHQRLREKNRQLYETVQQLMQRETREQEKVMSAPASAGQQLYGRLCTLMRDEQPYTNSELNRESLAQMLGTNYNAVAAAIRECADGITLGDFLDDWRIRHAAALLRESNDPIALVGEMSGFASRSHFNTLFRDKFKLSPSEYRKVAKESK